MLEKPEIPLNVSFDSDSISDSQHGLSLSLLDDECTVKRKPNVVVPESDYDRGSSESTSSTTSSLDFSSGDSVKDPDFQIRQDVPLSVSDFDVDCMKNVNDLSKRRQEQLSPKPGPSWLYNEIEKSGRSNPIADTDDVLMRFEFEMIDGRPSGLQPDNDNVQILSVGPSSVETASPCVENENIARKGHKRNQFSNSEIEYIYF